MDDDLELAMKAAHTFLRKNRGARYVEADVWHWVWPAYDYVRRTAQPHKLSAGINGCREEFRRAVGRGSADATYGKRFVRERTYSLSAGDLAEDKRNEMAESDHGPRRSDAAADARVWLGRMHTQQREATELYFSGLTTREVGRAMGVSWRRVWELLDDAGLILSDRPRRKSA